MITDETLFKSNELNDFIKKTDYIPRKTNFKHKILFYKFEKYKEYNYRVGKLVNHNMLMWFDKLNTYSLLSVLCPESSQCKSSQNNIVIYNKVNDKDKKIFIESSTGRLVSGNFKKIMDYYKIGKTIFIDCNGLNKSCYGLNAKEIMYYENDKLEEIEKFCKNIISYGIIDIIKYGYNNGYYNEECTINE